MVDRTGRPCTGRSFPGLAAARVVHRHRLLGHRVGSSPTPASPATGACRSASWLPTVGSGRPEATSPRRSRQPGPEIRRRHLRGHRTVRPGHVLDEGLLVLLEDELHAREVNLHILTGICPACTSRAGRACCPNRAETIVAMFASWSLGAAMTPINPVLTADAGRLPASRLRGEASDRRARLRGRLSAWAGRPSWCRGLWPRRAGWLVPRRPRPVSGARASAAPISNANACVSVP